MGGLVLGLVRVQQLLVLVRVQERQLLGLGLGLELEREQLLAEQWRRRNQQRL